VNHLPFAKKKRKKMTSYRKGKILKAVYYLVREREDSTCTICGKYYGFLPYKDIIKLLDVNHTKGRMGKLLFDPRFMSPLCSNLTEEKCHNQKFHKRTKYWRPILLQKLQEKYDNMSDEERVKYSMKGIEDEIH